MHGRVHLLALTEDPATLEALSPLRDEAGRLWQVRWVSHHIAELGDPVEGPLQSREDAARCVNLKLYALRTQFPQADEDEFYHADLIGMDAFSPSGEALGTVVTVHDYGAGVSLEIVQGRQSHVVPFTRACVPHIDMSQARLEIMLPAEIEVEGDLSNDAEVVVRQ
ncbi:ribosome maturation factor RimM [Candidatus Kirkpatrickella diaphorinae]|uniref:Ribosome maturation factor RimM n=1 Tax=Candidatus Kirkpatrickella diaphorinae TaxID=2984322 RepID=A0ABY6GLS3_9PROT|nr:ribosome maturation factor RimM [Candidatus Kirkpatrickella diaphorinae]